MLPSTGSRILISFTVDDAAAVSHSQSRTCALTALCEYQCTFRNTAFQKYDYLRHGLKRCLLLRRKQMHQLSSIVPCATIPNRRLTWLECSGKRAKAPPSPSRPRRQIQDGDETKRGGSQRTKEMGFKAKGVSTAIKVFLPFPGIGN